jgi:hypothetical protein
VKGGRESRCRQGSRIGSDGPQRGWKEGPQGGRPRVEERVRPCPWRDRTEDTQGRRRVSSFHGEDQDIHHVLSLDVLQALRPRAVQGDESEARKWDRREDTRRESTAEQSRQVGRRGDAVWKRARRTARRCRVDHCLYRLNPRQVMHCEQPTDIVLLRRN